MNWFSDYQKIKEVICNSGCAPGSDTIWELYAEIYNIKVVGFSYKTKEHTTPNKVEMSEEDYKEGIEKIKKANKILGRQNIDKYMNLLARNWAQVKYSSEIFAIGRIVQLGDVTDKGYVVKCKSPSVDGGTGYAVQMAIQAGKTVYVFDQKHEVWYKWSYILEDFLKLKSTPIIRSKYFAGIGTREINKAGEKAIENVFKISFENEK